MWIKPDRSADGPLKQIYSVLGPLKICVGHVQLLGVNMNTGSQGDQMSYCYFRLANSSGHGLVNFGDFGSGMPRC